jgi:hypothetical protein
MIALFLRIFSFAFPFDSIPTIIDRMSKMRRQIARNQMEERIFLNICRGKLFEKTGSMSNVKCTIGWRQNRMYNE